MEKELKELINKWLLKANNDLMMIENEFRFFQSFNLFNLSNLLIHQEV